jgi:hypothetical protein
MGANSRLPIARWIGAVFGTIVLILSLPTTVADGVAGWAGWLSWFNGDIARWIVALAGIVLIGVAAFWPRRGALVVPKPFRRLPAPEIKTVTEEATRPVPEHAHPRLPIPAARAPRVTGSKVSEEHPELSQRCRDLGEEILEFASKRQVDRPRIG